ncbi:MAG: acyltransferase [Alphaproteobacteria bacterium]|nr:acyltransferase [Alphaproteobacteria bacterium]
MPKTSIVSQNIRIRHLVHFEIGNYSIVDDFCYFSTKIKIGQFCHIAPHCTIAGGVMQTFSLGDYSSLSSGCKVYCTTNDFSEGLVALLPNFLADLDQEKIRGDVIFGKYTGVGTNSVIMPQNYIPEGVTIGALSFVPSNFKFEPWMVYAGIPIKAVKKRNKDLVLKRVDEIEQKMSQISD